MAANVSGKEPAKGATLLPTHPNASAKELALINSFGIEALHRNMENLKDGDTYLRRCYETVLWAYRGMLAIGFAGFIAALVLSLLADSATEAAPPATIGGLSLALFVALFLFKPAESLERDGIYFPWLVLSLNSYWTRLAYFKSAATIDRDIEDATRDTAEMLRMVAEHHAAAVGKYPGADAEPSQDDASSKADAGGATVGPKNNGAAATAPRAARRGAKPS